jgi:predicted RNA-binding Zn-ribbon protein involved in translation (DUF1610 family)
MKQITQVECPQCNEQITIEGKVKRQSFTNIPIYKCENCGFKGAPPLSIHTQIWYWTTVICVIVLVYYATQGYSIRLGVLGFLVPFALYHDWRTRKNVQKYRSENNLSPFVEPKVEGEVIKGVAYSALIIAITFLFSPWVSSLTNSTNATTNTAQTNWQPYHSVAGKFTLTFPKTPTVSSSQLTIPNYAGNSITQTTYESDVSNTASYLAYFTVYPSDLQITDHKTSLEGVANGSANNIQGATLVNSVYSSVENYPAIDYLITVPSKGIFLKSRAIEVGQALYVIEESSTSQNPDDYDKYVNSFSLNN